MGNAGAAVHRSIDGGPASVGVIQEPGGPDLPSHPPNQHHHLRSAALALRPPLIGWEEEEEGGVSCSSAGLAALIGTI